MTSALKFICVAAVLPLSVGSAAQAGSPTPALEGTYAYSQHSFCQPTFQATYGKHGVTALQLGAAGDIKMSIGVMNFDSDFQELKYSGTLLEGSPLLLQSDKGGSNQGTPLAESTAEDRLSYSNTDTTVTLGLQVYQAAYGHAVKGVAQHVALIALDSTGCAQELELDRQ